MSKKIILANELELMKYIIKKYPDSCMAHNIDINNLDDVDIRRECLDFILIEKLGLCACGNLEKTAKEIVKLMDLVSLNRDLSYSEITQKTEEYFGCKHISDNGLLQFMAYTLDDKELFERGTSINYPWFTAEGEMYYEFLKGVME